MTKHKPKPRTYESPDGWSFHCTHCGRHAGQWAEREEADRRLRDHVRDHEGDAS